MFEGLGSSGQLQSLILFRLHQKMVQCMQPFSFQIENTCPLCKQKFTQIEFKWKRVHYKSHKISKPKCKQNKIYVKDKSQSQKEDQFSVLLDLLIDFILADSINIIKPLVND
ncbi:unnamed protein product (macronuclear) [Paramecium tetraurelia]|uniref:C2H2-type domain-containing protein n=1 Tax=Paramecium tetraurelia TaxID=5888 RepID=A0D7Q9_PARTE|nr:uncharacterized protein GSPATT00014043001 [Paramecium tetraurelia]CAK79076.1 unnamed protein product [Paramecium tetraurelia]|eukprot:XP_001446473.1 hypothetical protein (macronuclear) [Paramecium tetraurelia strain d4-2]